MQTNDQQAGMKPQEKSELRTAALLLAKSSVTNAAVNEMQALVDQLNALKLVGHATFAFSEQGLPSLRETLQSLADQGFDEVTVLPWVLPMEPGFQVWVAKSVQRWRASEPTRRWPAVRVASALAATKSVVAVLAEMTQSAINAHAVAQPVSLPFDGSVVPPQKRRVLVCQGGPCNNAGAAVIWGYLRNEQKRLDLRTTGDGVMSAKSTCLGPCNLAPVLQVFPEGTYYGGVDEAGMDQIISEHLLGGCAVSTLAYAPLPGKQYLRGKQDAPVLTAPPPREPQFVDPNTP